MLCQGLSNISCCSVVENAVQANCDDAGLIIHARPTKVSKKAILATHTVQVVSLQMLLLQGLAPLHLAVEFGQKDTLRTLLHHRADINTPNFKVRNSSQTSHDLCAMHADPACTICTFAAEATAISGLYSKTYIANCQHKALIVTAFCCKQLESCCSLLPVLLH